MPGAEGHQITTLLDVDRPSVTRYPPATPAQRGLTGRRALIEPNHLL